MPARRPVVVSAMAVRPKCGLAGGESGASFTASCACSAASGALPVPEEHPRLGNSRFFVPRLFANDRSTILCASGLFPEVEPGDSKRAAGHPPCRSRSAALQDRHRGIAAATPA